MEDKVIYGIDLGTTFSAIAHVNQQGDAVCLNLGEEGEWAIPSAVLLDPTKRVFVGEEAIENCYKPETLLIEFAKRSIGLQKSPGWPKQFGDWKYLPEEISALILRKVAKQVGRQRALPAVVDVVVTHPQWFYLGQKEATREAAELAGLNLVAGITEPHAAAIAYGVHQRAAGRDVSVLVFDLGGGTFDVSLMKMSDKTFEMLGSAGDTQLGGMDWDQTIIARAKEIFQKATGDDFAEVASEEEDVALRKAAERAKKKLSDNQDIGFWVAAGGSRTRAEITRDEFEDMSRSLVARCIKRCEELLQQTSYSWAQVDEILMVGSSTKMPMIHEAIKHASGKEPRIDKDPKLMVAKGAAIWGHWIKTGQIGSHQKVENARETSGLVDLEAPNVVGRTAHGLGILATRGKRAEATGFNDEQGQLESIVSVLIGQNTATPCSFEKTFYTNQDNETSVSVPLYEGESEDPQECSRIGHIVMDGLPPRPKHQPVKVKFNIDTSGLLEVEMTDVETGRKVLTRLEKNILRGSAQEQEAEIDLEARRRHLDTLEVV